MLKRSCCLHRGLIVCLQSGTSFSLEDGRKNISLLTLQTRGVKYARFNNCLQEGPTHFETLVASISLICTCIACCYRKFTGWCIWSMERETQVFVLGGQLLSHQQIITEIWGELVHTLCGEWGYLSRFSFRAVMRSSFLLTWSSKLIFHIRPRW